MKVLRYKDKLTVLKEARKLKNTDIWINENFSKATAGIRKSLEEFLCQKLKDEEITVKRDLFLGTTKLENLIGEITITMMIETLNFNFFNQENTALLNNDSNYCNVRDFPSDFNSFSDSHFSILSLNIRSMNKNFENFRFMLNKMEYKFKLMSY